MAVETSTPVIGGEFFNSAQPPVEPPVTTVPGRPGHFIGESARKQRHIDARTRGRLRDDEEFILLLMGEI